MRTWKSSVIAIRLTTVCLAGMVVVGSTYAQDLHWQHPSSRETTSPVSIIPHAVALDAVNPDVVIPDAAAPDNVAPDNVAPVTVAPNPAAQTIRGVVVDQSSQIPLPGANVIIVDSSPLIGTTSDENGRFAISGVPLGRHDLRISYLGYETVVLPQILVSAGKEVVIRVEMQQQILIGDEVVVRPERRKDRALNDLAFVSARSFSVEETRRYAGGLDDPARMASAFAGITTGGNIQENAMIIRGNAPKGVLWRLEGVDIPNPSHFAGMSVAGGGGLTLFSSQLLADSDFFTGAFPAEYGNALAGVFDMKFRSGNQARREHTVQAGVIGIEVASEGPFRRGKSSSYLFNYRYSTLGLLLPLLPTEDVANYQDLSFKLTFPTRKIGRFDVWGIGGLDGQAGSANEDSTEWEYEMWDRIDSELSLAVGAAGISHDVVLGSRSYLHSGMAVTINRTALEERRLGDDLVQRDNLSIDLTNARMSFSSYLNRTFGLRHTNRTGFSVQRLIYNLDLAAAMHTGTLMPVALESGSSMLLRLYSQSQIRLSSRLTGDVGVHVQHFALTGRTSIEPRTGLRWHVSDRNTISFGYGLHSQIEELRLYFVTGNRPGSDQSTDGPNRRLDFARAHHFVLGYDRVLSEALRIKAEAYYQALFDIPVIADSSYSLLNFEQDFEFNATLVNAGAGRNYGLELTVERFLLDGFYYLASGSLFRSRYRGGDGIWRDSRFDRGYSFNMLFGKEISVGGDDLLGVNARVNVMGGKRRSPVDVAASLAAEEVIFDESRPFSEREPGFFILDLTVTYRRNHKRSSGVWALQVKNVLGSKDVFPDYNFADRTVDEVREGFPLPILSYKIEF